MIMVTAAAVLHGRPGVELRTAGDVARQLGPLFGPGATGLFCVGIFAGAFSSFLVNAMIGGTVLADGLGKGGSMDDRWPKVFTVVALATGMVVALGIKAADLNVGALIIFAQAMTVLGNPLLAGAMLWLATRRDLAGARAVPLWMRTLAAAGFILVLLLSARTGYSLYLKLAA
jgi:Mn2+/Fe2+ NRAMP family transporter